MNLPIYSNFIGTCVMRAEEIKLMYLMNGDIKCERNFNCAHLLIQMLILITLQHANLRNVWTYH